MDVDELGKQIREIKSTSKKDFYQDLIEDTENDIEYRSKTIKLNWIAIILNIIAIALILVVFLLKHQIEWDDIVIVIIMMVISINSFITIREYNLKNSLERKKLDDYNEKLAELKWNMSWLILKKGSNLFGPFLSKLWKFRFKNFHINSTYMFNDCKAYIFYRRGGWPSLMPHFCYFISVKAKSSSTPCS